MSLLIAPAPLEPHPNVPAPLEPLPNIPVTPPANPLPLDSNSSPEPSPTIPIAIHRVRREIRAPTEWWKVRQPPPVVPNDSDNSDDEDNDDTSEFAGAAHDLDPKSLKATLGRPDEYKWGKMYQFWMGILSQTQCRWFN